VWLIRGYYVFTVQRVRDVSAYPKSMPVRSARLKPCRSGSARTAAIKPRDP
jgi:hypothetical protein